MKSSYKLAISDVELQIQTIQTYSKWKKKLSMGFLHAKIIWQNFANNFIKHILLISEELSSGVYVRGFFMWHWLDPARRYSTPIHKVSYSLLWSRDEEKCLALLVRNPRFSCKKKYISFCTTVMVVGKRHINSSKIKRFSLIKCSIEKLQNFHFTYPECSMYTLKE